MPTSHDGQPFTFELAFSEEISISYVTLRDEAFVVNGGSVTKARRLEKGKNQRWEITVEPDTQGDLTIALPVGPVCEEPNAICTADGRQLSQPVEAIIPGPASGNTPATGLPAISGTAQVGQTMTVSTSGIADADGLTGASYIYQWMTNDGSSDAEIAGATAASYTLTSAEAGETIKVRVSFTDDGGTEETLISAATAAVTSVIVAVTASFENLPEYHDGSTNITIGIVFSEAPVDASPARLEALVNVIGATVVEARRTEAGNDRRWTVELTPSAADTAIQVSIPATTDCSAASAICSAAGGMLDRGVATTIGGVAEIAISDATAVEGPGATLDFVVTMSRALREAVTMRYGTRRKTAIAGLDYVGTKSTFTIDAGETEATIVVPVIDDAIDEGEEWMEVWISRPSRASARISDNTARGTITNDDPMPQAWLARFGRTVAGQAVDMIAGRLDGGGGTQVTVGGQALDFSGGSMTDEQREALESALTTLAGTGDQPSDTSRSMTGRELLLGSAFQLSAGGEEGAPAFAAWGRFATGGFDAEEDGARMDGSVTSGFLGADVARARWLAGLAVGLSEGEGGYANMETGAGGDVETTMTALYPYGRLSLTDRLDVWGLAGFGEGELDMTHGHEGDAEERFRTDVDMRMGAVGARGEVLTPAETGGLRLAVRSDAFWVRTSSDAVEARAGAHGNLAAAEADASRLRLIVEGSRSFEAGSGSLTPSLEVGVRHDGGDAETGTGIEAGASLRYEGDGVSVEGSVHMLVAHEESGYEEWGASGAVRIDPGASGRGLSLTLAPTWGVASGGTERLWGLNDARGLAPEGVQEPGRRFEAELGYGVGLGALPGTVTPYAGLSFGEGEARAWRTGARWAVAPGASVSLEGTRSEAAGEDAEPGQALMLRGSLRW